MTLSDYVTSIQKANNELSSLDVLIENIGKHMGRATTGAQEQMTQLGSSIKAAGTGLLEGFKLPGLAEMVSKGQKAFDDYGDAGFKLQLALEATSSASNKTISELTTQADKLQHTTLFSSTQTQEAQAVLLHFTNIKDKIFTDAIPAIQNFATSMSGDGEANLKGAARQVGVALSDPIKGIDGLKEAGVNFSTAQKDTIKQLVESGRAADAQRIILDQLGSVFGDSAQAARQAQGGYGDYQDQLDGMYMVIGKVSNTVRETLSPIFATAARIVGGLVQHLQGAADWLLQNKVVVEGLAIGLAVATTGLLIYNGVMALSAWYTGLSTSAIIFNTLVTEGLSAAWLAVNIAMSANPIGAIIMGIAILSAGIYIAYQKSASFRAVLSGIGAVAKALIPIFVGLGKVILGALTFNPKMIADGFKQAYDGIKSIAKSGGIKEIFNKEYKGSLAESAKKAKEEKDKESKQKTETQAKTNQQRSFSSSTSLSAASSNAIRNSSSNSSSQSSRKVSESVGGSKGGRNIIVNIQKLIGIETMSTTNIREGAADAGNLIKEALIKSIRDSEIAVSSE
jgi:hypothetical protein